MHWSVAGGLLKPYACLYYHNSSPPAQTLRQFYNQGKTGPTHFLPSCSRESPSINSTCFPFRYRERFWRESTFQGIELVRGALDQAYGAGKVSLVSAAFRWLNHHSLMQPEYNGGWSFIGIEPHPLLQSPIK